MKYNLPPLPYPMDGLAPFISQETLEYHYGKHHQHYVDVMNDLTVSSKYDNYLLEEIIKKSTGTLFNNASQVWNHNFYWNSMKPKGGGTPTGALADSINDEWGSFDNFKEKFTHACLNNFGSGWTWLVKTKEGGLNIVNTSNADSPLTGIDIPLLVCDVWEHAYYIDYRNERQHYIELFWNIVNWDFANKNLHEK